MTHSLVSAVQLPRRSSRLERRFVREVSRLGVRPPSRDERVSPREVEDLPPPARRYMQAMGVLDRPRDWCFSAHLRGRFRLGPDAAWKPIEALQFDTSVGGVARIFHMELPFLGVLRVLGRDTYQGGAGRLLIRPMDLFTVEDDRGPELDVGELVTYLNDVILFAPSMLLGSDASFHGVDDSTFDVRLSDGGLSVGGRVTVDDTGLVSDFTTTDRFVRDPHDPKHQLTRCRWSTPVEAWGVLDGRPLPSAASAVWHLPTGDFSYARMDFGRSRIHFNTLPPWTEVTAG